jgi:hypothetical protein
MTSDIFRYSTPIQYFLLGKVKEYHIHYNVTLEFEEAYRDHNKRRFVSDVYRYVVDKYATSIKAEGMDECYHEDGISKYIYLHLDKTDCDVQIKNIMNDLEIMYKTEWCKNQVPKLLSIVKNNLKSSRIISQAVSHYQHNHGFIETQRALHVLHNDIIPANYFSDSDDSDDSDDSE